MFEGVWNDIKTGGDVIKTSFSLLNKKKSLLLIPILNFLVYIALLLPLFFSGLFFKSGVIFGILAYLLLFFSIYFLKAALVSATKSLMEKGEASIGEAFGEAFKHVVDIIILSVFAAIVGVIVSIIRSLARKSGEEENILGSIFFNIVAGIISFSWTVVSMFSVAKIINENKSAIQALKESIELGKNNSLTYITSSMGFEIIFGVGLALGVLMLIGGAIMALQGSFLGDVLFALGIFLILGISLMKSTIDGISAQVLYKYATEKGILK